MKKLVPLFLIAFFSFGAKAQNYNNDGDTIFASSFIHVINFNFSQTGFWDSLTANYTLDRYMMCTLTFDGFTLDSVGVKLKGNSSYNNSGMKKSFKVDLAEYVPNQDIEDLNKFNLNNGFKDPSFLREKVALDFYNLYALPAPRCTYAKVYINNQYWGLYTLVEEVNKDFLDDRFNDKGGNLFKGDPSGDLKWLGASQSFYTNKYELKTNETVNDWSDLIQLINIINNTTTAEFQDSLNAYLNVNEYLYQRAVTDAFVNLDSYMGSGHNYYLYHDSLSGKWRWIVWDVNESFGNFNMGMNSTQIKNLSAFFISSPNSNRPLDQKIMANTSLKQQYADALCDILSWNFCNWVMWPKIDSLANRIRNDVYADPNKFFTNQNFEDNIVMDLNLQNFPGGTCQGIKPFILARRAALASELSAYGCVMGYAGDEKEPLTVIVFPNPASDNLYISVGGNVGDELQVTLTDILGRKVKEARFPGPNNAQLDISNLSPGIYSVGINNRVFLKVEILR